MSDGNQLGGRRFFLDVKGGVHHGTRVEIPPKGLIVGRSSECDLILPSSKVSRQHAAFYVKEGECYVEDMGSKNGVLVQGKRVEKRCLEEGDVIDLGYCRMRLRIEGRAEEGPTITERPDEPEGEKEQATVAVLQPSLHPFVLVSLGLVVLTLLHWLFGVGAAVFGVLAISDILLRGKYYGMGLAAAGVVLGLVVGVVNVSFRYAREAGIMEPGSQACMRNLGMIYGALERYAGEHDGLYPGSLEELAHVGPRDWLDCPVCHRKDLGGCTYLFPGAGWPHDPDSYTVIVCDSSLANHGRRGGHVLRADGTVEWLPAVRFRGAVPEVAGR